jgi:hypothetical protein
LGQFLKIHYNIDFIDKKYCVDCRAMRAGRNLPRASGLHRAATAALILAVLLFGREV